MREDGFMILIVEGADLVGKSTLASRVAAAYGWPIVKIRWALIGDAAAETHGMARATIELLCATTPNVIFDRIYFSWWAYGQDVSFMPKLIADFARVPHARLVLLTASAEELRRRHEAQPDLYFSLEVIQDANARFPSLLPLLPSTLPVLHIDTTATSPDDVFEQVQAFIAPDLGG